MYFNHALARPALAPRRAPCSLGSLSRSARSLGSHSFQRSNNSFPALILPERGATLRRRRPRQRRIPPYPPPCRRQGVLSSTFPRGRSRRIHPRRNCRDRTSTSPLVFFMTCGPNCWARFSLCLLPTSPIRSMRIAALFTFPGHPSTTVTWLSAAMGGKPYVLPDGPIRSDSRADLPRPRRRHRRKWTRTVASAEAIGTESLELRKSTRPDRELPHRS